MLGSEITFLAVQQIVRKVILKPSIFATVILKGNLTAMTEKGVVLAL